MPKDLKGWVIISFEDNSMFMNNLKLIVRTAKRRIAKSGRESKWFKLPIPRVQFGIACRTEYSGVPVRVMSTYEVVLGRRLYHLEIGWA